MHGILSDLHVLQGWRVMLGVHPSQRANQTWSTHWEPSGAQLLAMLAMCVAVSTRVVPCVYITFQDGEGAPWAGWFARWEATQGIPPLPTICYV